MANPFDFNRDGRWSTSERAFTHYGVDRLMRKGSGDGRGGCGCTLVLLAVLVALFVLFLVLGSVPG